VPRQPDRRPVWGLVLTGGKSRRMGADKALLEKQGQTQLARTYALLDRHLARQKPRPHAVGGRTEAQVEACWLELGRLDGGGAWPRAQGAPDQCGELAVDQDRTRGSRRHGLGRVFCRAPTHRRKGSG